MNDQTPFASRESIRSWLLRLAEHAVSKVHPANLVQGHLPEPPCGRTVVVGAGKAAAAMAKTLETAWQDSQPDSPLSGVVVTRYGHVEVCQQIEVLEASHPMPDNLGEQAAKRMLEAVRGLGEDDLVIALVSGGGSSLMSLPAPGLTLSQKQALTRALLHSGAPIREINTVRRHLSAIKGGRLAAAAHPAQVVTYLISDVPGDEPSLIASGPTLPDGSTPVDALTILEARSIEIPDVVRHHFVADTCAPRCEDDGFAKDETHMLARAADALQAALEYAEHEGIEVRLLGDDLEGEARQLGRAQGRLALDLQLESSHPLLLLSGGETSVTVDGEGRGGRNVEYLLGLFEMLKGAEGIHALAIDTDGIDGSEDNAGAMISPDCWQRAEAAQLSVADYLARNDAYTFFQTLNDLIITGPTRTNVNDFRAILVLPPSKGEEE
ncbi:glycerate kinase [Chromohalobacter japonicus]|uniref:Glycerate kinase n=1 Tax=Chromohalobacter japonicus TaxID=223900 RepID=A0A1Q8T9X6_9GAMM|nr:MULTISPECIES: glycerate kinase [Chromohalobacter]OLO10484.1 glycerate kinase [Chromohalobacter japonicus]